MFYNQCQVHKSQVPTMRVIYVYAKVNLSLKGFAEDPINYPLVAKKVCDKVIESNYTKRGMLICGTGIGMAMTANKFKGIRAAVCHDIFSTQRSILSNNGNVLCMGERVIGVELAKTLVNEWISLEFKDGPSTAKVQDIINIETENMK